MQFDLPRVDVDDMDEKSENLLSVELVEDYGDDQMSYTDLKPEYLTYCKILSTRHPMFAFVNRMLAFQVIQYITSIFPQRMAEVYDFDASQVSYVLVALTGMYFFGCVFGPAIIALMPRRVLYVVCLFIATVAYIFIAPSTYIGLPEKSLPLVIIGLALAGASMGPTVVSTLPEALDTWKLVYNHCEGVDPYLDGLMTDVFASIHVNLKCFVAAVCPVVAGAINNADGW